MVKTYHGRLKADSFWVREPGTFLETRGWVEKANRHWTRNDRTRRSGILRPSSTRRKSMR
jgi:hypothetical protein